MFDPVNVFSLRILWYIMPIVYAWIYQVGIDNLKYVNTWIIVIAIRRFHSLDSTQKCKTIPMSCRSNESKHKIHVVMIFWVKHIFRWEEKRKITKNHFIKKVAKVVIRRRYLIAECKQWWMNKICFSFLG